MSVPVRWTSRHRVTSVGVALALVLALAVVVVMADHWNKEKSAPLKDSAAAAITTQELTAVSQTRVFFGHQSVGANILTAVPGIYQDHGVSAPPIGQGRPEPGSGGGFIAHKFIGENTKPLLKIEDFDQTMRGGMGRQVDVAIMKFCSIDINSGTDVDALFARYRDTMDTLERDFPGVTFIHVTVPLTTDPDLLSHVKTLVKKVLGRSDPYGRGDNAARERLNVLIRREYGGRHLLDLAAVESTKPDGSRISGHDDGQEYFALYDGYAADRLHLNAVGSAVAATAFLKAIAQASRK